MPKPLCVLTNFPDYGSIIWRSIGFSTVQTLHFQCGFKVTGLVFNLLAMTIVDKVKRPTLIAGGMLTTSIILAIEMTLQRFYVGTSDRAGLIGCAAFILLFQASYSFLLDGSTFFYIAEIWPSHVRSQGFAIGIGTLSLTNLVWLQAAPKAFEAMSWRFYLFFVCILAFGAVVIFFFYHDTLHKPLEEIAAVFGDADMVAIYQRELDLSMMQADLGSGSIESKGGDSSPEHIETTQVKGVKEDV
jgi:hypothetical protein